MNNRISTLKPFMWLLIVLILRFFFLSVVILKGDIALSPDEAQYWTWSQDLSYGYFSKPPGIAWQIALTTFLFGSTEWGIRFGALIIGSLIPVAIYRLARGSGFSSQIAALSGILMALIPLGMTGSMLAVTDGGMLLFWTLACKEFVVALRDNKPPHGALLGTIIALGALFKWSIFILLLVMIIWSFWMGRKWVKAMGIAFLFSLLGLLPSLAWNLSNHFVTFKHVSATLLGGDTSAAKSPGNLLEFIGAQAALLSPLFFIFFLLAIWKHLHIKDGMSRPLLFLFVVSLLVLFPASMALFEKVQGNWAVFVYPTAVIFTVYYMVEISKNGLKWYYGSLVLSVVLAVAILALPTIQAKGLFNSLQIPYKSDPFKNTLGWRNLALVLKEAGYDPNEHYLVSDNYQMTSLLSFYGPLQKRAYFLNLDQRRENQFSFWPGLSSEKKLSGFFVTVKETYKNKGVSQQEITKLKKIFKDVDPLPSQVIFKAYGRSEKEAFPIKVAGYN